MGFREGRLKILSGLGTRVVCEGFEVVSCERVGVERR